MERHRGVPMHAGAGALARVLSAYRGGPPAFSGQFWLRSQRPCVGPPRLATARARVARVAVRGTHGRARRCHPTTTQGGVSSGRWDGR
eukprot:216487-Prymnesium_polylepis.1